MEALYFIGQFNAPVSLVPGRFTPNPCPPINVTPPGCFVPGCFAPGLFAHGGGRVVRWCTASAGASYNLDYSRARAYCTGSMCGWGLFGHFFIFSLIYPFSILSPSLWETAHYRLKYCLKGPLNPKQPTNQPTNFCPYWTFRPPPPTPLYILPPNFNGVCGGVGL